MEGEFREVGEVGVVGQWKEGVVALKKREEEEVREEEEEVAAASSLAANGREEIGRRLAVAIMGDLSGKPNAPVSHGG